MLMSLIRLLRRKPRPDLEGVSDPSEKSGDWYDLGDGEASPKPIDSLLARVTSRVVNGGVEGISSTIMAGTPM